jgi:hypothetical protein
MSRREVQGRLIQSAQRYADALHWALGRGFDESLSAETAVPGRFFFDGHELPALIKLLQRRRPAVVDEILKRAERICLGEFDLLGYTGLRFGDPIDWHYDPVHEVRVRRRLWFRVPYLDFSRTGDHKIIWELNRHQHLVLLARAWRLGGERRFLDELLRQWHAWRRENPYPMGINWASSLEVAFRLMSWLWIDALVSGSREAPERLASEIRRGVALHARHIERYLSTYFAPNTHLLGEGVALFFAGLLCPEFQSARRWQETGWSIVLQEAQRQVRADGFHFEQSTYYHVYALDFFLHARVLAARNGLAVPRWFDNTLHRMAEALHELTLAGPAPRFGDDDGGRVFDGGRNRTEHIPDPLAVAATLFNRGDFKTALAELPEETIWLLGEDGVCRYDSLAARFLPPRSKAFAASGLYCLASPTAQRRQIWVDAGPHGFASGGHGHADALSVQWVAAGRPWLIDPGACCYPREKAERDRFRGTAAHSTVCVDGLDQAQPVSSFAWGRVPQSTTELWCHGGQLDLFVGSHNGYGRLRQPVRHRRWVVSWQTGECLIRDVLLGEGRHHLEQHWLLAPDLEFRGKLHRAFVFASPAGDTLTFQAAEECLWASAVLSAESSPCYGVRLPAPMLRYETATALPAEHAVMLGHRRPHSTTHAVLRHVDRDPDGCWSVYSYLHGGRVCLLGFSEVRGSWQWRDWQTDASFVCLELDQENGETRTVVAVGGRYLRLNGRTLIQSPEIVECWEWQPARRIPVPERDVGQLAK